MLVISSLKFSVGTAKLQTERTSQTWERIAKLLRLCTLFVNRDTRVLMEAVGKAWSKYPRSVLTGSLAGHVRLGDLILP